MRSRQITDLPPRGGKQRRKRSELPPEALDFEPRPMVANFAPGQLLRTAFRTFFAHVIARYVDRRETQASLPPVVDLSQTSPPHGGRGRSGRRNGGGRGPWQTPYSDLVEADLSTAGAAGGETWIDFIADLGDGWNPAYAMALQLASRSIQVEGLELGPNRTARYPELKPNELPRADVLVLGGDQVYPTPSREGYTDRLVAPLACALPRLDPPTPGNPRPQKSPDPLLFAVPGNHDWYDGLTDFVRVFCQGGQIGRWRMKQRRSYFAVRLPNRWWLWGIDIQLDTRIDPVQLAHFRKLAKRIRQEGDSQIILCTAKPAWLHGRTGLEASYKNLIYFENQVLGDGRRSDDQAQTGRGRIEIPVTFAGDMHHYARYLEYDWELEDAGGEGSSRHPRHRVTCGAGGAYLRGTHTLPLRIPRPKRPTQRMRFTGDREPRPQLPRDTTEGELIRTGFQYPSPAESTRLARGALRLPLMPHNWGFCLFLGAAYAALAAAIGVASYPRRAAGLPDDLSTPFRYVASLRPSWDAVRSYARWVADAAWPWGALILALMIMLTGAFALMFNQDRLDRAGVFVWGLLHGLAHGIVALLLAWGLAGLTLNWLDPSSSLHAPISYLVTLLAGALIGGFLVAFYLLISAHWFGLHEDELFSVQSIPDYRSFIRMRIGADGDLTIFPIGVRRVPRRWRRRSPRWNGEHYFDPADDPFPQAHLIEGPIRVAKLRKKPSSAADVSA